MASQRRGDATADEGHAAELLRIWTAHVDNLCSFHAAHQQSRFEVNTSDCMSELVDKIADNLRGRGFTVSVCKRRTFLRIQLPQP